MGGGSASLEGSRPVAGDGDRSLVLGRCQRGRPCVAGTIWGTNKNRWFLPVFWLRGGVVSVENTDFPPRIF